MHSGEPRCVSVWPAAHHFEMELGLSCRNEPASAIFVCSFHILQLFGFSVALVQHCLRQTSGGKMSIQPQFARKLDVVKVRCRKQRDHDPEAPYRGRTEHVLRVNERP